MTTVNDPAELLRLAENAVNAALAPMACDHRGAALPGACEDCMNTGCAATCAEEWELWQAGHAFLRAAYRLSAPPS